MKTNLLRLSLALLLLVTGVSCSTVYDQYGRPRTVVEPGAAALGVAAAGLAGYAIARDRDDHHYHRGYYPRRYGYYGHRPHYYYH
jgi:hypothetical protein